MCGGNTFAALGALPGDHMGVMQHGTSMLPAMDKLQSTANPICAHTCLKIRKLVATVEPRTDPLSTIWVFDLIKKNPDLIKRKL